MTNEKLKPCPFCGGEAHATPAHGPTRMAERVACLVCAAELSGTGSIEQWQARAQLAAPAGVADGLRLVPVVPTDEMLREMTDPFIAVSGDNRAAFYAAYCAMLAAAPSPEPASDVVPYPKRLKMEPYQTVDKGSTNYKAGWNAAIKAMEVSDVVQVQREVQDEAERCAFVLENIGSMDAEDIDGDAIDLRFEAADGRDTGCDVSIVEYAERAANVIRALLNGGRL